MAKEFNLTNGSLLLSTEAPGGIYNSAQLKKIASLCDEDTAIVKATEDQRLALFVPEDKAQRIADELRELGLGIRHYQDGLHQPVTCIGEQCPQHEQDALGASLEVTQALADITLDSPLKIGINGCNQCCVPCHTLDISIVGETDGYRISVGGKTTTIPEMAAFLADEVPPEKLPTLIHNVVETFKNHMQEGESLQEVMERVGTMPFVQALTPYSQDAAVGDLPFEPPATAISEEKSNAAPESMEEDLADMHMEELEESIDMEELEKSIDMTEEEFSSSAEEPLDLQLEDDEGTLDDDILIDEPDIDPGAQESLQDLNADISIVDEQAVTDDMTDLDFDNDESDTEIMESEEIPHAVDSTDTEVADTPEETPLDALEADELSLLEEEELDGIDELTEEPLEDLNVQEEVDTATDTAPDTATDTATESFDEDFDQELTDEELENLDEITLQDEFDGDMDLGDQALDDMEKEMVDDSLPTSLNETNESALEQKIHDDIEASFDPEHEVTDNHDQREETLAAIERETQPSQSLSASDKNSPVSTGGVTPLRQPDPEATSALTFNIKPSGSLAICLHGGIEVSLDPRKLAGGAQKAFRIGERSITCSERPEGIDVNVDGIEVFLPFDRKAS